MPDPEPSATRYVIGIGSQRAGSTLLHRILSEATPVVMHPLKELHVFDTAGGMRAITALHRYCRHVKDTRAQSVTARRNVWRRLHVSAQDRTVDRTLDLLLGCESAEDVAALDYRDLFRPLAPDDAVVGEITPEYMLLRNDALKRMYETVGPEARVILMRRDPVQRFISAYYLSKSYLGDGSPVQLDEAELLDAVERQPNWVPRQWAFSDYDFALEEYRTRFPYVLDLELEHLVSEPAATAATLERFLGLDVDGATVARLVGRKANAGMEFTVSDELRDAIQYKIALVSALRREAAAKEAAADS